MADRFDLEQQILECWHVTDDIRAILAHGDKDNLNQDFEALARLTDIRFEKLWFIFENLVSNREFTSMTQPASVQDNETTA